MNSKEYNFFVTVHLSVSQLCLCVRFEFEKYVLCPYLGKPVEREKFEQRSVEDMGYYLRLTDGERGQQGIRMKSKMVLQVCTKSKPIKNRNVLKFSTFHHNITRIPLSSTGTLAAGSARAASRGSCTTARRPRRSSTI